MDELDETIFKAYDIRGIYGEQIDGDLAEQIGRAFARTLAELVGRPVGELTIGLGRDMRLTAPTFSTRDRSGPRCSISWSARAAWTAG
jgi:phosphomannomutase